MGVMQVLLLLLLLWRECLVRGLPLCTSRRFEAQAQSLLLHEMLSLEEVHEIIQSFDQLQDMFRTRWEGAELFAYGSLFTGLGTKTSDIDFYLRIPDYNNTADAYIVQETAEIMYKQPEKYDNIKLRLNQIIPMMSYHDVTIQRDIDLSFRSSSGIENTKLLAYYLSLDDRYLPLTAIIKFWCKVHHLAGKGLLPNYAIYLLVMFYLQQRNMLPSGQQIQVQSPARKVNKWNTNFEQIPYKVENKQSLYELLGGFFNYYSTFNFTQNCVSGFVARPIPRSELEDVDTIPQEFSVYKSYLQAGVVDPLELRTGMCLQDIFEHNSNVAKRARHDNVVQFINQVKITAKMYNELSCEQILQNMLLNNRSDEKSPEKLTNLS